MMEALRRGANSIAAKVLLGLLVLSFAVWGVGDIFSGYRGTEVARVGDTEIGIENYRAALQREIQSVSQRIGTYLTLDQARSIGLDQRVLGQMMAEAALVDAARERGLNVSDATIAQSILNDPSFRAPGGQFDRAYFEQVLRASGYSEAAYVAEQRQRLLQRGIAEAVSGASTAPRTLAAAIDRYRNETRTADYIVLNAGSIDPVGEPDEQALRAYFDANVADFAAPEYRSVALIEIQPETLAEQMEVTDDDARAYFEARRAQFEVEERRAIEQIPFDTPEAAEAARQAIEDGQSFIEIAEAQGVAPEDLSLGTMSRSQIVDPAVAEAAFALAEGEVSQPIEGQFTTVLIRVTQIEEGSRRAFEDVADQVRRELAVERARGEITDIYDLIEDDRAAGMTLAEIAERRSLPFRVIDAIDREGRDPDGRRVDLPDPQTLLPEIFNTGVGIEADPVQVGTNGYGWFEVSGVTPARDRNFEEARTLVEEAWRRAEIRSAMDAKAEEIAGRLRAGERIADLAWELGGELATFGPATRTDARGAFGQPALGVLFNTREGEVGTAPAADPLRRVVFVVTDITVPDYQANPDDPVLGELATVLANDVLTQYLAELEAQLGAFINQAALDQALGLGEPEI